LKQPYHTPVLLKETVDGLNIQPQGIYVDCTFGGGGHARAILEMLDSSGRLIVFDQDAEAAKNLPDDARITFINQNFRHIGRFFRLQQIKETDGILADLGVSSYQFDEAARGFSIRFDAPLDMRMDQRQDLKASDIVQTYSVEQLHKIFEQFGEVSNAKTLARTIVSARSTASLKTVDAFRNALRGIVKGNPNKYFARVFQALRIEVNDEMGALKELLQQVPMLLKPGGRVAVITFHSIEDRLVKNFFRRGTFDEPEQHPFIRNETQMVLKPVTKKPITPSASEVKDNPRARSAKLRIAEKL
jgi:16S rRNA (cytosine1402-N4)-methyltransferase